MTDKIVRFDDDEAEELLEKMAVDDRRSQGNTVVWLIRAEAERREEIAAKGRYLQKRMVMASVNGVAVVDPAWLKAQKPEDSEESPDFGHDAGFSIHTV